MIFIHSRFLAAFALVGISMTMVVPLNHTNLHPLIPQPFTSTSTPLNGKSVSPPHLFLSHSGPPAPASVPQSNAPVIAPAPTNGHESLSHLPPPTTNRTQDAPLQAPSQRPHHATTKMKIKTSPKLKSHHSVRSYPADEIKSDTDAEMLMIKRGYPITRWRRSKNLKKTTTDDINIMAGQNGSILTIHGNKKHDEEPEEIENDQTKANR